MYSSTISTCPGTGDSARRIAAHIPLGESSQSEPLARLRVLVVDDDRDLADTTQTLLEICGIQSQCVYSVESAISTLERDPSINVVLSDVIMPGLTGLDLAAIVKACHPLVGIVLVSGYTSLETIGAREYMDGFIAKPYKIDEVIVRLIKAMRPYV